MLRVLAAAVALLLLAPVAARAHSGNPNFESIVTRVEPPGLQVEVLNRDDRIALRAPAGREVEIPGYDGDGDGDGGGSDGLAIVALVVGGLGLAAGAAGLAMARRVRGATAAA
jgi:hypothetical protein